MVMLVERLREANDRLGAELDALLPRVEDTMAWSMLSQEQRDAIDMEVAAMNAVPERPAVTVAAIQSLNRRLVRAQEAGDLASSLIVEGQLAGMRARA